MYFNSFVNLSNPNNLIGQYLDSKFYIKINTDMTQ